MKELFKAIWKQYVEWVKSWTYQVYIARGFNYINFTSFSLDIGLLYFIHRERFEKRFTTGWLRINDDQFNLVFLGLGIHINTFAPGGAERALKYCFEVPGMGLIWKGKKAFLESEKNNGNTRSTSK